MSYSYDKKTATVVGQFIVFALFLGLAIWLFIWIMGWSKKKNNEGFQQTITHPLYPLLTPVSYENNTFDNSNVSLNPEFASIQDWEQKSNIQVNLNGFDRPKQRCFMKDGTPGFFMTPNRCSPDVSSYGASPQMTPKSFAITQKYGLQDYCTRYYNNPEACVKNAH